MCLVCLLKTICQQVQQVPGMPSRLGQQGPQSACCEELCFHQRTGTIPAPPPPAPPLTCHCLHLNVPPVPPPHFCSLLSPSLAPPHSTGDAFQPLGSPMERSP